MTTKTTPLQASFQPVRRMVGALALTLAVACGGGGGGPSSGVLTGKGSASGTSVLVNKLRFEMQVEDQGNLSSFAQESKDYFGEKPENGHFHVEAAAITLDIANSGGGVQNYQDAFTGDVVMKLKPSVGTDAGVPIGTIKKPTGNGKVKADVSYDQKQMDTLKDEILDAKFVIVVEGPTNWNNAETKKLGLIGTIELSASK